MAAKFTHEIKTVRGVNTHHITWKNDALNKHVYEKILHWVTKSRDYSALTPERATDFCAFLKILNKQYNTNVSLDQALSVRNIILKHKLIKNYSRMNIQIARIAGKYEGGDSILSLSNRYDFPPLNLLRGIFIYRGIDKVKTYSIFANKTDPSTLLTGRDLQQYLIAEKNDAESTFNQRRVTKVAFENEDRVVKFFKSIGINVITQDDLAAEQKAEFGRAVLTPDLLFTEPVYINNEIVHWIDYKDYIGTEVRFLYSSNIAQAAKYAKKWGPGALCYHRAYVEGLTIPDAILLDARSLPCELLAM